MMKRYTDIGEVEENDAGDYVLYEDVMREKTQMAKLIKSLSDSPKSLNNMMQTWADNILENIK